MIFFIFPLLSEKKHPFFEDYIEMPADNPYNTVYISIKIIS